MPQDGAGHRNTPHVTCQDGGPSKKTWLEAAITSQAKTSRLYYVHFGTHSAKRSALMEVLVPTISFRDSASLRTVKSS
jgi:hypothetical protein